MFEDERIVQAMNAPTSDFREVRGRSSVVAFFISTAPISISPTSNVALVSIK